MLEDGLPAHWPKQETPPSSSSEEQAAIRALARVRELIVSYHREDGDPEDWRVLHAQTSYIVNVVEGLIVDAKAIDALHRTGEKQLEPLRKKIQELEEALDEAKRPFTAQMQMQNNTIIQQNAEIVRLTTLLNKIGIPLA